MHTMRKLFALTMVALLSLTVALAAIGCGGQQTSETTTTETPTTEPAPMDTMSSPMDTTGGGSH
jgi:ABC-type glycerol-3-phosphate transport system substrate-binding protein